MVRISTYVTMTYPLANETVDENGMTHSLLRLPAFMKIIETNQLLCVTVAPPDNGHIQ
jgi:hypothetical protein